MQKSLKTPVFSFQVYLDMQKELDRSKPVFTLVYSNQQNLLQLWQDLEGWEALRDAVIAHLVDARTLSAEEESDSSKGDIEKQFL